jgi:hypothetical protein
MTRYGTIAMNPVLSHIAAVHATFRAHLVPVMDRFGNQQSADSDERVRLRYRLQAEAVAAYLVALSELLREWPGPYLVPPSELKADCAVVVIENPLLLPSPIELPAVDVRGTRFLADASFNEAHFLGAADFDNADFEQGGAFRRTVFCKRADFVCAMGGRDHTVDFTGATFIGYADFEDAIHYVFKFADVKFLDGMDFS